MDNPFDVVKQAKALRQHVIDAALEQVDPKVPAKLSVSQMVKHCQKLPGEGQAHDAWVQRVTDAYATYRTFVKTKFLTNTVRMDSSAKDPT